MAEIVVVGAGGMGREAAEWLRDDNDAHTVAGFLDADRSLHGTVVGELPVLGDLDWLEHRAGVEAVVAVGAGTARRRIARELSRAGVPLRTVIHPTSHVGARTTIAAGAIICPGAFLSCDVRVASLAIVNFHAAIGHDGVIGEAAFIGPGARLAGTVTVGDEAEVGIGASIVQGTRIGEGAVVGAGAAVVSDVPAGVTVLGVPARPRSG